MIAIEHVYWLIGAFLVVATGLNLRERRWAMAAFWAVLASAFLFGDAIQRAAANGARWPAQAMGLGVIALGLLAASGKMQTARDSEGAASVRRAGAQRLGNRLFVPALAIPLVTLALVLGAKYLRWGTTTLIDPAQPTLISLGIACTIALVVALRTTRAHVPQAFGEGRRLLDTLGCVAVLPMLLATLGAVFAKTGVGDAVAQIVSAAIPTQSRDACVLAYGLGMALFTIIMGNAFAAFPVITAGVGLPLLIGQHHGHAAVVGALGMLCGYCGTLLTPMAANFNIVLVALLELRDPNAVIRAQWPTAVVLFATNLLLLDWLAFR